MPGKSDYQIFLAHATEDKPQVRELYRQLQAAGYRPWLDEEDLLPGQLWRDEIPKAIKKSDLFIACLSTLSVAKEGYVQREFRLALNYLAEKPAGKIYLIPLKLDDCKVPDLRREEYGVALRDVQWLDYWKPDGFDKLLQAIVHQRGGANAGTPQTVANRQEASKLGRERGFVLSIDWENNVSRGKLYRAIKEVYRSPKSLEIFANYELGLSLNEISSESGPLSVRAYELVEYCHAQGNIDTMFAVFCKANLGNPIIEKLEEELAM